MTPTRTPSARLIAIALAALCTSVPARAQDPQPAAPPARVLAAATMPRRPEPIREAARAEALNRSADLTQAQPPRNGCGNRVVLGGAIGGGAGAVLGFGLLYGAGGSDSAGRVVASVAALGAALGALGGLVACGP